jgi:ribosomal-protein-alanine N-acetyltransferase
MHYETERLIVRDIQDSDWESLCAFRGDPDVARYTEFKVATAEQTRAWMHDCIKHNQANPRFAHLASIVLKESNGVIGYIGIGCPDDPTIGDRDFGYSLRKDYWGRGLMPEAVRGLLRFCFEGLKVKSAFAQCLKVNKASARVMEKSGMRFDCEFYNPKDGGAPSFRYMALAEAWLPKFKDECYCEIPGEQSNPADTLRVRLI